MNYLIYRRGNTLPYVRSLMFIPKNKREKQVS
nr:MAG TPA: hypothetical protein [Caudoviricetes sp.]